MNKNIALGYLYKILRPGMTIYTYPTYQGKGMSSSIKPFIVSKERPVDLSSYIAALGRFSFDRKNGGLKVGGYGTDKGFEIVYDLGHCLFLTGYECHGTNCGSNDHSNGDRDYTPHHHKDGGYAFKHEWL